MATGMTELIGGRYEPLDGAVAREGGALRAVDRETGAIVMLRIAAVTAGEGLAELEREAAQLAAEGAHPALPRVLAHFSEGGRHVLVSEWVEGTDLATLLRDQGVPGLPLSSVLSYLAEAAEGLTYLHSLRPPVMHGDVRPGTLVLTRGGRVRLVGLGWARLGGGARSPVPAFGPAPDTVPSPAGDVFALAATARLLIGGEKTGDAGWERFGPTQAARLQAALDAGLDPDPARRPATPVELVDRLRSGWASTLPTGEVTFVMSDVEDSTRLWETHPEAMAEALVRHDEIIAGIAEARGGRFVKAMGEGDSTTSVFDSAGQALAAAIEATRALAATSWPPGVRIRSRFGLHSGATERRGAVYLGTTVNLAARVRGQARGGEILLSDTTAALVGGDLPEGYEIVELGAHTLRGIKRPEAIRAVVGRGLATAARTAECPYRGLLAFEAEDRDLFFGREEVLREVLSRIEPGGLLAVVGPSGSGKSSLVRAGVIAAVREGALPCARSARLLEPGARPLLALGDAEDELLVVDQFEELYTQCDDAELRASFIDALLSRRGPVVIGLRADFYGEVSAEPRLARAVADNQVLLGPMQGENLRRAIVEPARVAGLELEPGLADLLLTDAAGEPGALPLISHALRETWERRDGRTLSVAAYRASGGVSSAVARTADAIVQATPAADRPLLRDSFLRLTELGDGVEDTRRRLRIDELVPGDSSPERVRALLARLADARLVTLNDGTAEIAHEILIRRWPRLRHWLEEDREGLRLHRRLGDAARLWEAAGRESADLYRGARLETALEWARVNGARLNSSEREFLDASAREAAQAERQRQATTRRLRRALVAGGCLLAAVLGLLVFALASRRDAVDAEGSARSQALATESEAQVSRDPQLALLLARAALASAATPQAELAASEALDANTARSQLPSLGAQGCDDSNYLVMLDGSRVAADDTCDGYVVFADVLGNRILRRVKVGPQATDMVLDAGGRDLLVGTGRDLVRLDLAHARVTHIFTAPFGIEQIAGPPGRYLAIADREEIALADLRRGTTRVVARGDPSVNGVNGMMAASPTTLLVASTGQSAGEGNLLPRLTALDVYSGRRLPVELGSGQAVPSVVYLRVSPDGRRWYITGSEVNGSSGQQVATTWAVDAATRRAIWTASGPTGAYASPVQVSPDGRYVAVGYSNGAADVLEAAGGRRVVRDSSSSTVASGDLAFAAGDSLLVTASLDGLLRTWRVGGSERMRVQAPAESTLAFAPGGEDLVLLGQSGEIVDGGGRVVRRFAGVPAGAIFNYCGACSSATPGLGRFTYLAASSGTPSVVELEGRTGRRVGEVAAPRMEAQGVAPNGQVLAAWVESEHVLAEALDPVTGRGRTFAPGPSDVGCIALTPSFSAGGRLVAISDGCRHVDVWEAGNGRLVRALSVPEHATGPAILTADGRRVLVPVPGGAFERVDVATGAVAEVPGEGSPGNALAASPDGSVYAIGREDGTVDEYDAGTLRLIRRHALANPVRALAFSADGRELAVIDTSNLVRVWDTCESCENAARLERLAAAESVRALTPAERQTFGVP